MRRSRHEKAPHQSHQYQRHAVNQNVPTAAAYTHEWGLFLIGKTPSPPNGWRLSGRRPLPLGRDELVGAPVRSNRGLDRCISSTSWRFEATRSATAGRGE